MGRNLEDTQKRGNKGRINYIRPKSEKFPSIASKNSERSSNNIIQKNLDDYIFSLSNVELKQKLESCPGNLGDCPLLKDIKKELKKSISNHINIISKNDTRTCKTSRTRSPRNQNLNTQREKLKMNNKKSSDTEDKKKISKNLKTTPSNTSGKVIRSTRAQDLRSQSNRDLLKPKTTIEKTRTASPYVVATPQKKKKGSGKGNTENKNVNCSNTSKTTDDKKKLVKTPNDKEKSIKLPYKQSKNKKEKSSSAGENLCLQRQKTQEIINPKFVKKCETQGSMKSSGDSGDCGDTIPELKKSQTFFICKGTKNGEGDDINLKNNQTNWNHQIESSTEENPTDDEIPSPKPKPLTHNDSFCLIVKSSQNWSQKNRSDDEKWLEYGLAYEAKNKKTSDKGILKNSGYDLKSVDSLEKVESEKIVRFSDELLRNKKVLKKLVRRKKRLQNFFTPNWYQKNKLFQKYLEILREKSVLLSERSDIPEDLKPFRVPVQLKERYEAEMFGLYPRKEKFPKNYKKKTYSY